MSHASVLRDRPGTDRVISNCSLPLPWEPQCTKHYEHDDLMVIAANMDHMHFTSLQTLLQLSGNLVLCNPNE